jgi:membrane-bound serine protease (ClpP class)
MQRTVKDWLIVLASLLDDAAIALFILLVLWLLKIPISLPIIIFVVMLFIVSAFVMHKLVIPALHRRKTTGGEGMIGLEGEVVEPLMPNGLISVKGEYWKAISAGKNIAAGEKVEVIGLDGLTLKVKHKKRSSSPKS